MKVALAGNPNCGKSALFNALTGGRAKVGNYSGVTVERKEGLLHLSNGKVVRLLDLPGTYSLDAKTLDEQVTRDVLLGMVSDEASPDLILAVVDSTALERSLAFVLELRDLGIPTVLVLNMIDLARARKIELELEGLSRELGIPVLATAAIRKEGVSEVLSKIEKLSEMPSKEVTKSPWKKPSLEKIRSRFAEVDRILGNATLSEYSPWTRRIDSVVLHPIFGSLLLLLILGLVFQAIFAWAKVPMEWIENSIEALGASVALLVPAGPLQSLLVDGVIAGVGAVLVFLPQILLLFTFIMLLEDSGYLPRAAFMMDKLMGKVGLHGRAFIPLLSSFACAIPGIMATRTIENRRDRLITILVAPLMTCSARLPVYALLIAAFIPNKVVFLGLRLQGLVMLGLYASGIGAALLMAFIFRRTILKGETPILLMELPTYKWPSLSNLAIGLLERARLFVARAGTVILSISVVLWFLASYPKAPVDATEPAISYSFAGQIGHWIEPWVRPIGFDWKIAFALIPSLAAREVMVGTLATVYAVGENVDAAPQLLSHHLAEEWSIATGLSLLVWYVLACQCVSTLAVTRRETNSWKWPAFMLFYMTVLAYLGSFLTYTIAVKVGL